MWSCCVAGNDLKQLQVWPYNSFQQLEVLTAAQNGLEQGCLPLLGSLPALQELLLPRNQLRGFPQPLQEGHFQSLRVGIPAHSVDKKPAHIHWHPSGELTHVTLVGKPTVCSQGNRHCMQSRH